MTAFVLAAIVLALAALAFLLPPFLRRRDRASRTSANATNVAIYQDQLRELEADLAAGTLSPRQHEAAKREIERRLLEDVAANEAPLAVSPPGRGAALVLGLSVPVAAVLLYLAVGSPQAIDGSPAADAHGASHQQIEAMVTRLAERMKEKPDDPEGWFMLGRSYTVLERYAEAAAAYANAVKRSQPDAQLLADYADALAMSQGRRLQGEPERLIQLALTVDPNHPKALALAGSAAFEKNDFKNAAAYWERLLKVLPPESEMAGSIRESVAEARSRAGTSAKPATTAGAMQEKPAATAATTPAKGAELRGSVQLSPTIAAKAGPDDLVFVFARPAEGGGPPLAALRKRVRDLPFDFQLDDTMSMTPTAKLSDHARVVVGARIAKSGSPSRQPGDLEGVSAPLKLGATGIKLVIDTEVR